MMILGPDSPAAGPSCAQSQNILLNNSQKSSKPVFALVLQLATASFIVGVADGRFEI